VGALGPLRVPLVSPGNHILHVSQPDYLRRMTDSCATSCYLTGRLKRSRQPAAEKSHAEPPLPLCGVVVAAGGLEGLALGTAWRLACSSSSTDAARARGSATVAAVWAGAAVVTSVVTRCSPSGVQAAATGSGGGGRRRLDDDNARRRRRQGRRVLGNIHCRYRLGQMDRTTAAAAAPMPHGEPRHQRRGAMMLARRIRRREPRLSPRRQLPAASSSTGSNR